MKELYEQYMAGKQPFRCRGRLLSFFNTDGSPMKKSVYNTTPPLWLTIGGVVKRLIAGRVENLHEWALSEIMFFEECGPLMYRHVPDAPIFKGEDPSIAILKGEIILFFVQVSAHFKHNNRYNFETKCYRGFDIHNLKPFGAIPGKDNRVVETPDGHIAFTPRPQGYIGGTGTIAYTEIPCIEAIVDVRVTEEMLIPNLIPKSKSKGVITWGGVNQLICIRQKNEIGFVAHGAFQYPDTGAKVYVGIWKKQNRNTGKLSRLKILAVRDDFPATIAKAKELENVFFPSGLDWDENGVPWLYGGLSDTSMGVLSMRHDKEITDLAQQQ
ncbi:MAG: DUF1861 family protein [Patescibacteria group bacterium]